jgi:hypothetical protein
VMKARRNDDRGNAAAGQAACEFGNMPVQLNAIEKLVNIRQGRAMPEAGVLAAEFVVIDRSG